MTTATTTIAPPRPGTYVVDKTHTEVGFVARHLIGTKVRGRFTDCDATVVIADPPRDSTVRATAVAASIDTGVEMRDEHLRSNDFLDAPGHPELAIVSTGLTQVGETRWELATDLSLRGVTRPVVFDLEYHGAGPGLAPDSEVVAFSANAEIDRRDFGVSFNKALDNGGLVVGNKVRIELEVEAARQS